MSERDSRCPEGGLYQSVVAEELLNTYFNHALWLDSTFTEEEVIKVLSSPFCEDTVLTSRELTLRGLHFLHLSLFFPLQSGGSALHLSSMIKSLNLFYDKIFKFARRRFFFNGRTTGLPEDKIFGDWSAILFLFRDRFALKKFPESGFSK